MSIENYLQRGPYLYRPGNIEELRFASSGEVDRSFSILISEKIADPASSVASSGITVLDNDNLKVVFDGLYGSDEYTGAQVLIRFYSLVSMSWADFAEFCRNNAGYRGEIEDINSKAQVPSSGSPENQISLGLSPIKDARSEFVRAISDDEGIPYSFPVMDRDGMMFEICRHLMYIDPKTPWCQNIAWDIRMNMNWNRTGRLRNMTEMDREQDADWRHMVENDPEIIREACEKSISAYVSQPVHILDMEQYPCEFETAGKNNGFLILKKFCGFHINATHDISIADRVMRLSDDAIEALWVACHVLDKDLSPEERRHDMEYQMHLSRMSFENPTETKTEGEPT